ncbi:hypothetical protein [Congregibacter litoralis]|uniref:PcRGLX/YetA-like N-terminal RIFT barrel domain-containing protein n=1 Tax=Congregibacter litoralis KT71 TaxID=314285 RepID=A4A568_9GAMM|nr:hypothetical protein [Congregibacter litoralis]EAQ98939.2 hypothetical protein KT71_09937 [Congregibacter litoralis KT71]
MSALDLRRNVLFPVVTIVERDGLAVEQAPVTFGAPLPQGRCFNRRKITLVDEDRNVIPASIGVSALWPDSSIKWCLIRGQVSLKKGKPLKLGINVDSAQESLSVGDSLIHDNETNLRIKTGQRTLTVDTQVLGLFDSEDPEFTGQICLGYKGTVVKAQVEEYDYCTLMASDRALSVDVNLYGCFELGGGKRMAFRCAMQVASNGDRIDISLTIHNPAAAEHPDGLWDLGDAHSLFFDNLSLGWRWDDSKSAAKSGEIQITPEHAPVPFDRRAVLIQMASGGKNWDSPVHQNQHGDVTLTEPGFVAEIDDRKLRGPRADPSVSIVRGARRVSVRLEDFWQRFPSQLSVDSGGVNVDFLPLTGTPHELQAGERCTHRCSFHFADSVTPESLHEAPTPFPQPVITLEPVYVEACALPELGNSAATDERVQSLIDQGLNGENNFFAKREAIDEYGWRNFGDLWADHETEGHDGGTLFVSHYNNQYDPLFGFLRQFLRSGEQRWLVLADDLARHTVDIDIYHTDADRPEYNHGLFWHTDHYQPAETSSHRSYSRRQPKDAYEGHAGGGGPGGQHCYTSGLLHHYLLTGNTASRDALYELKNWISKVYEGSDTFVDLALALKNRNRPDLKNHLTGRYPLDRGIANYLNALMDCYVLDQSPATLAQLAHIIQHTIHPTEDLEARALTNIEEHWFYVVLLQALCRYLTLKKDLGELDDDFFYARDCLLHYADWMVENEAPYLTKPERLEFPNHTWTAQDLRKANVLFWAAYWSPDNSKSYA